MKYQVPEGTNFAAGLDIGGEHFPIDTHGVLELPDGGDYSKLLSSDYVPIQGAQPDPDA